MSKERKFRVILDTAREKKKHFGRGDKHLTVLHFRTYILQSVALKSVCNLAQFSTSSCHFSHCTTHSQGAFTLAV